MEVKLSEVVDSLESVNMDMEYYYNPGKNEFFFSSSYGNSYDGLDLNEDEIDFRKQVKSDKIKLSKCIKIGDKFNYIYDFGDYWVHKIIVEEKLDLEDNMVYPKCIKGKMAPLPEDVGGPYGYMNFMEIMNNPKHLEYKNMKEWAEGTSYIENRDEFNLEEINENLECYKEHAELLTEKFEI